MKDAKDVYCRRVVKMVQNKLGREEAKRVLNDFRLLTMYLAGVPVADAVERFVEEAQR